MICNWYVYIYVYIYIYILCFSRIPRNLHVFSVQLPTLKTSPSHLTPLDPRSCANSPCWNVAPPGNRGIFWKIWEFLPRSWSVMDGSYIGIYPVRFIHPFIHSFIHAINPCHAINPSGSESIHSKTPVILESLTSPEKRQRIGKIRF